MSGRPLLPTEKGFSLIETVIAISCSTLLLLALLSTTGSILLRLGDLNRALERDENLELAPLILAPLLSQAGNNMAFSSQPAVELQGEELARIDHRFGNEGDFGRPERFSESFAIDPVQVE